MEPDSDVEYAQRERVSVRVVDNDPPRQKVDVGNQVDRAVMWVAKEFSSKPDDFASRLRASLETTPDMIVSDPSSYARGAELFTLEDPETGELEAAAVIKYYPWEKFRKQIVYETIRDGGGKIQSLKLAPAEKVVPAAENFDTPSLACELAYINVKPESRGKGVGGRLSALLAQRISSVAPENPKVVFVLARGAHLPEHAGDRVLNLLLENEREANGNHPDGRAIINGMEFPTEQIRTRLKLGDDFDFEEVDSRSQAVPHIATKMGLRPVGLFKDLSPFYATVIPSSQATT